MNKLNLRKFTISTFPICYSMFWCRLMLQKACCLCACVTLCMVLSIHTLIYLYSYVNYFACISQNK